MFGLRHGFNIIIGNPPYGIIYDIKLKKLYESKYSTFKRNNDIYVAFFEQSLNLLCNFGVLCLITPNTYLNGDYFKSLRKHCRQNSIIRQIVDFKNSKIFQDPTVFVSISLFQKIKKIKLPYLSLIKISNEDFSDTQQTNLTIAEINDSPLKPINPIIEKILSNRKNDNIFILEEKYLVKDVGFNYWTIGKGKKRDDESISNRIFYSGDRKNNNDKSFLKGKDIEKYLISKADHYLRHDFKDYLIPKIDIFRYSQNYLEVSPKIVYRQTANKIIAALDYDKNLCDKTVHIIIPKTESESLIYLLGLLNSQLFDFFYKDISQELEGRAFVKLKPFI